MAHAWFASNSGKLQRRDASPVWYRVVVTGDPFPQLKRPSRARLPFPVWCNQRPCGRCIGLYQRSCLAMLRAGMIFIRSRRRIIESVHRQALIAHHA